MNIYSYGLYLILTSLFVAGCFILFMAGCQQQLTKPKPPTSIERLTEAAQSTNWLVTVSILGVALSTAAFLNGSRAALGVLIGSIVALTMTLMVARFATWIAILGLIGAVGIFVYTIFVRRNTLVELVKTVEIAKMGLSPDVEDKRFKTGHSYVNKLQSSTTKKLVQTIKRKVGL